jgi:hypothetical protein
MKSYVLKIFILTIGTFSLLSCTIPIKDTVKLENEYIGKFQLRNTAVPLPEGQWKVIGKGTIRTNYRGYYSEFFEVILLNVEQQNKFAELIQVVTESDYRKMYWGYRPSKRCKSSYAHYASVKKNEGHSHDCWIIDQDKFIYDQNRPALIQSFEYLISNKYKLPKIYISSYHHFTGNNDLARCGKYLDVKYYHNPEAAGLDVPIESDEWNPEYISNDSKKVEYIEKLISKETIMHERIQKNFIK